MSISSINSNSSLYSGIISSLKSLSNYSAQTTSNNSQKSSNSIESLINLNDYYTNSAATDLMDDIMSNVSTSAEMVQEAMTSALENGMSVNDACKISSAMAAYNANCTLLSSTFSLSV